MAFTLEMEQIELTTLFQRIQGVLADKSVQYVACLIEDTATENLIRLRVAVNDAFLAVYSEAIVKILKDVPGKLSGTKFFLPSSFFDVVRELPAGPLKMTVDSRTISLKAGHRNEFSMKIGQADHGLWREEPVQELSDSSGSYILDPALFSYALDQVSFCIAPESQIDYAAVLHLQENKQTQSLRLVASDGCRISYCDLGLSGEPGAATGKADKGALAKEGVSLSKKAAQELRRICSEEFERIELTLSRERTFLRARTKASVFYARLSAVNYPDYTHALPEWEQSPLSEGVSLTKDALLGAVKRVFLASEKGRTLQIDIGNEHVSVFGRGMTTSEGSETLELEARAPKPCKFTLNGKFLSDIFLAVSCDKIVLQYRSGLEPIVVSPLEEPKGCRSRHIVIPIDHQLQE